MSEIAALELEHRLAASEKIVARLESEVEKLKAENDELKRIIDLQKTEYNDLLEPHFVEKIEKLSKKCEVLSEAVKEIKFHEDKYIQNSNETSTMYLDILNKALAEAESIK